MPAMRLCRSCDGPVPRASLRCPWCKADRKTFPTQSHAPLQGKRSPWRVMPPPDLIGREDF